MRHAPHFPDLAKSDYHLLSKYEETSPWTEIFDWWSAQVRNRGVAEQSELLYFASIKKLPDSHNMCIGKNGDYVEK